MRPQNSNTTTTTKKTIIRKKKKNTQRQHHLLTEIVSAFEPLFLFFFSLLSKHRFNRLKVFHYFVSCCLSGALWALEVALFLCFAFDVVNVILLLFFCVRFPFSSFFLARTYKIHLSWRCTTAFLATHVSFFRFVFDSIPTLLFSLFFFFFFNSLRDFARFYFLFSCYKERIYVKMWQPAAPHISLPLFFFLSSLITLFEWHSSDLFWYSLLCQIAVVASLCVALSISFFFFCLLTLLFFFFKYMSFFFSCLWLSPFTLHLVTSWPRTKTSKAAFSPSVLLVQLSGICVDAFLRSLPSLTHHQHSPSCACALSVRWSLDVSFARARAVNRIIRQTKNRKRKKEIAVACAWRVTVSAFDLFPV